MSKCWNYEREIKKARNKKKYARHNDSVEIRQSKANDNRYILTAADQKSLDEEIRYRCNTGYKLIDKVTELDKCFALMELV